MAQTTAFLIVALSVLASTHGAKIVTKVFKHNAPVTDSVAKNLKLTPAVAKLLEVDAPLSFEATVLGDRYKFQNRELLNKALLHGEFKSKVRGEFRDSFEPLDLIGTMVLDYMINRHLFLNSDKVDSRQIDAMKGALVRQDTIAFIAVKNHLDDFIFVDAKVINGSQLLSFKKAIETMDAYQKLVEAFPIAKQRPTSGAFIHRMLKAVIGAVYVDTGYDMQKTDDVFMPMFKTELDLVFTKVTARNQSVA